MSAAEIIARHYTCWNQWAVIGSSKFPFPGIELRLGRMSLVESYVRFSMWITGSTSPFMSGMEIGFTAA